MVTAMRVAADKEGEGGKAMTTAARVACKRTATTTKRAMAMKTRMAVKEEGNGKGGKSDGDGKEEGAGKEDGDGIFHPSIFGSYVNPVKSIFFCMYAEKPSQTR
jgi:hypothetical protein